MYIRYFLRVNILLSHLATTDVLISSDAMSTTTAAAAAASMLGCFGSGSTE